MPKKEPTKKQIKDLIIAAHKLKKDTAATKSMLAEMKKLKKKAASIRELKKVKKF